MPSLVQRPQPPIRVRFRTDRDGAAMTSVVSDYMNHLYSIDMVAEAQPPDGKWVSLVVSLKSGRTDESLVRYRVYEFFRHMYDLHAFDLSFDPVEGGKGAPSGAGG